MIDEITVHLATGADNRHAQSQVLAAQKPRSVDATQKLVARASGRSQEIVVPWCGTDHARLVNTLSVIVTYWAAFSTGTSPLI